VSYKFATLDVCTHLLSLYHSTTNEHLRISAAVTISHVCKVKTAFFPTIFEGITCKKYCQVLCEGPSRVQQAFITMLNIALQNGYEKLNDQLTAETLFRTALKKLLEHSNVVIRGKSIITGLLILKMNPHWMILLQDIKFYQIIERMVRDTSKYIQHCLMCVMQNIVEMIPSIIESIKSDLMLLISKGEGSIPKLSTLLEN